MTKEYTYDDYLLQQELDYEAREAWAAAHCCFICEEFDTDGPYEKGWGLCRRRSCEYKDELDLYFVHQDEVNMECWNE